MINSPYKLLMVDIDGTLLGRDGTVLPENREALTRVCDLGIKVSLSTGRTMLASRRIINQLSLDGYHIFFDGALVINPAQNKEVYAQPIGRALVEEAVEFAHLNDINLELYSTTQYFIERETWASDIRRQYFGIEPTVVDFTSIWERERIIKGTVAVNCAEERAKADSLCHQFKGKLGNLHFSWTTTPAYPDVDFVNIVAPEVSKGRALEALTLHLGIPLAEVMAIGDERNDVSLLALAGLAIAMDNAIDEVKAVADHITLDVDRGGVAAAIEKFLL